MSQVKVPFLENEDVPLPIREIARQRTLERHKDASVENLEKILKHSNFSHLFIWSITPEGDAWAKVYYGQYKEFLEKYCKNQGNITGTIVNTYSIF